MENNVAFKKVLGEMKTLVVQINNIPLVERLGYPYSAEEIDMLVSMASGVLRCIRALAGSFRSYCLIPKDGEDYANGVEFGYWDYADGKKGEWVSIPMK